MESNKYENIIKKLTDINVKIKSEDKLIRIIKRKSFKKLIELANGYKEDRQVKSMTSKKLNSLYVNDILLRRVVNKYISAIEVSMSSVLLNHFADTDIIIHRRNRRFETKHMNLDSQESVDKFDKLKNRRFSKLSLHVKNRRYYRRLTLEFY